MFRLSAGIINLPIRQGSNLYINGKRVVEDFKRVTGNIFLLWIAEFTQIWKQNSQFLVVEILFQKYGPRSNLGRETSKRCEY